MSIFSSIAADIHNETLALWVKRFEECTNFKEFLLVLEEFKKERFSE